MTPAARTRLERVRASAGIVKLAVQQIEDELGGPIDAEFLAEMLRELFDEAAPQDGVLGSLKAAADDDFAGRRAHAAGR